MYYKGLPRNLQEIYDPVKKRERVEKENAQRIIQNIYSKYGGELKRINILQADKYTLENIVDELMVKNDDKTNRYLINLLRGHYPKLANKIRNKRKI